MKVTWKKSSRADGYRIYRRPAAGKWVLVADVAKNLTSYTDTGLNASTKYVYTVRPYKKGGNVKYMSAVKLSNKASTPAAPKVTPSGDISNSSVISNTRFTAAQKDVMKKILYAVETGGQVYGNQKYGDFTEAFTNSSTEYAITIGAGQWYGTEAQRLLKLIMQRWERMSGIRSIQEIIMYGQLYVMKTGQNIEFPKAPGEQELL